MKTLAAMRWRWLYPCLFAQQPQVDNARLETHALQGSLLCTELAQHGGRAPSGSPGPEPIIPGRHGDMCWSNGNNEDSHAAGAPVRLEGQTTLPLCWYVSRTRRWISCASRRPIAAFDGGGLHVLLS